jgi:CheY-like chemotaxis protein
MALSSIGIDCDLQVLEDGASAWEYMRSVGPKSGKRCPDMIILDLNLPVLGGYEVLQKFRQSDACQNTPVVIATSTRIPWEIARLERLGISEFFQKPIAASDFMELGRIVAGVLENRSPRDSCN